MAQTSLTYVKSNKGTLLLSALVVACLLFGFYGGVFFGCIVPLVPGELMALPFRYPHGGSIVQERMAIAVGFVVNTTFYAWVIGAVRSALNNKK